MILKRYSLYLIFINIIGIAASFIGLSIITKIFDSNNIGTFTTMLSIFSLLAVISTGKLELLLIKNIPLKLAAKANLTSILFSLIFSILVIVFVTIYFNFKIAVLSATLLISINVYDLTIYCKMRKYGSIWTITARTIQNILFSSLSIVGGLIYPSYVFLIIAYSISRLSIAFNSISRFFRLVKPNLIKQSLIDKSLIKYAAITSPSFLISNSFMLCIPILLNLLYGPKEVTYYTLQTKFLYATEIILGNVINKNLISNYRKGLNIRIIFNKYILILILSSIVIISVVTVLIYNYSSLIYANEYTIFKGSIFYMIPLAFSNAIYSSLYIMWNLMGLEKTQAKWEVYKMSGLLLLTLAIWQFELPYQEYILFIGLLNFIAVVQFFYSINTKLRKQKII